MQKAENEEQRSDLKASLNGERVGGRVGVEVAATVVQNRLTKRARFLMYRVHIKFLESPRGPK